MAVSCKIDSITIKFLTDYTKRQLRNPESLKIHSIHVVNRNDKSSTEISDSTIFINYLFSAKNQDGYEVYRTVQAFPAKDLTIKETFPKNIDVEYGSIKGNCTYKIMSFSQQGMAGYLRNGEITFLNIDTMQGKKTYSADIKSGEYSFDKVIPGDYFMKVIDKTISLENLYQNLSLKNFYLLQNMSKIMSFVDIYGGSYYGFENKKLFKENYESLKAAMANSATTSEISDSQVSSYWENFMNSISKEFILDFSIYDNYKYLVEFEEVEIIPNQSIAKDINFKEFVE